MELLEMTQKTRHFIYPTVRSLWLSAFRYYLCTDSSGLSVGTSRVVEVGCEGPNPSGNLVHGSKQSYFPPFLKLKFTQLASTAGRDTPNIY